MDPIFVKCFECDGSGEPYDGEKCAECEGFGRREIEGEPLEMGDLDVY